MRRAVPWALTSKTAWVGGSRKETLRRVVKKERETSARTRALVRNERMKDRIAPGQYPTLAALMSCQKQQRSREHTGRVAAPKPRHRSSAVSLAPFSL